jgi:transketolase C-terminal domain/subunit
MINKFRESIFESAKKYSNVVLLTTDDLYDKDFAKFFHDRQLNLGPGLANALAASVGFAARAKMPFVLFNSCDLLSAMDQVKRLIVEPNLNVKMIGVGKSDNASFLEVMSGIEIVLPSSREELNENISQMVNSYGPSYLELR